MTEHSLNKLVTPLMAHEYDGGFEEENVKMSQREQTLFTLVGHKNLLKN